LTEKSRFPILTSPFIMRQHPIPARNSLPLNILPVTDCSPEIKPDFAAKLMIPIDRGGRGVYPKPHREH
jgi:hypothetical protein